MTKDQIDRAAKRFANAVAWRIFGLPIVICAILAIGFLAIVIASLFEK